MLNKRASGVLLHISSLPSKYGIGCFDECAYAFVDFLKEAGQHYWQILPLCPTTVGDSPYQSISTFALNEYFIDLDALCRLGYLKKEEYEDIKWFEYEDEVDYYILTGTGYYIKRLTDLSAIFQMILIPFVSKIHIG